MNSPFLEIIEEITSDPNLLMWKYADADKEIKNGAKLTVRESQHVMFLNEGKIADIFGPGMHTLSTANVPLLSQLKGWKFGFESPFKADVYFFNTHQFINNKWGTPAPILMKDPEFGQVRIRAFGSFDFRISDVACFFREYAGTYGQLTLFELQAQLRDFVAPKFGEVLANQQLAVTDVAGNISELSKKVAPELKSYFAQLGIELTQFIITSVTLPEEVTAHYDKMTNMNMVKDMDKFAQFNTANAIGDAKSGLNESVQQGAMLNLMMQQAQLNHSKTEIKEDIPAKLKQLKDLFDAGILEEDEYKIKKAEYLTKL